MQDYIDVLLCHLADTRQNALPGESFPLQVREQQALNALLDSLTAGQRKLFLAYEEARNSAEGASEDAFARQAFLLAREVYR